MTSSPLSAPGGGSPKRRAPKGCAADEAGKGISLRLRDLMRQVVVVVICK